MLSFFRLCLVMCVGSVLVSCGSGGGSASDTPVVCTTTMIADLAREVAGPEIAVEALMGPGVDPHTYELPARSIAKLRNARVVLYNGLHLEGRLGEILGTLDPQRTLAAAVAEKLPEASLVLPEGFDATHADPHVWGDASLWAQCVDPVRDTLSKAYPGQAAAFAERAEGLKKRLLALHDWAKQSLEAVPQEQRVLITSHDAFHYFGRAYGLEVMGVQGISTASEAGLSDVLRLAKVIKERGVKAVFVESSVSRAAIETLAKDSGARIGGVLYSDSLGAPGTQVEVDGQTHDAGTYEGMLRHNVKTVVEGLR